MPVESDDLAVFDREREAAARKLAKISEQLLAEKEARLYQADVPLICLGCETRFVGPLSSDGCPNCHLSSLVVTQEEHTKNGEAQPKLR